MRRLRQAVITLIVVIAAGTALAQGDEMARTTGWRFGVFTQGGTGLASRSDVQMWSTGGFRFGHTIGKPFGGGATRTTFELNAEIIPYERFYWPSGPPINGFAANPVVMKWTFVGEGKRRVTPFLLATGGLIATKVNLPPGDTNTLNFTPGFGGGFHWFTKSNQAITADVRAIHISNASLGNHNPGINATLQMSIGYTWFKR